jgi:biopolymer transport protein ExbB
MIAALLIAWAAFQDAERLSRAAAQAEAELREFRLAAVEEEKKQQLALEDARRAVRAAAAEVIDLAEANERLRAELAAERMERSRLLEQAESLKDLEGRAGELGRTLRADLEALVASMPPLPSTIPAAGSDPAAEIDALLAAYLEIVAEGGRIRRFTAPVLAPDGRRIPAELLRIGHVFTAFRDPASGTIAVTVGAPNGDGFRWTTALSRTDRALVEEAFSAGGKTARVPVDVAQSLTADHSLADQGAWAFIASGGPVMIPLGIVAALSLLLCAQRFVFYTREGRHRPATVQAILELCRGGFFADAHRKSDEMGGAVARVLSACLAVRDRGLQAIESAAQEALLHERPRLERFLPLLAVFAGVAPMLGLLGTVAGIIATFEVISQIGRGDPALMAGGISEALVATGTGLFVAIPLLVLHSHFAGRVERIAGDAERHAATLINILGNRAREPEAGHGTAR